MTDTLTELRENLHRVLTSEDFSPEEKWLVRWQFSRQLGGGSKAEALLTELMIEADQETLDKLELGFPLEVGAFTAWRTSGIAETLREKVKAYGIYGL
jgi:hypothetical protein